jgi:muramidase (phage lysozyme)
VQSITTSDAAVGRLAHNLGISTEGLSAWEGAAERVGGSAAGIDGSMQSLTGEFQNFVLTGQSSVIPYFRALNVSISDNKGHMRDIGDIYLDLADKFSHMDPQRANAFGRALGMDQGTINLLEQGRAGVAKLLEEQRKLGVVSEKDAENAQRLQKNFADLRQAFTSVGRTIVNELTPGIIELLKHWSQWLQDNREWITINVAKWVGDAATAIKNFVVEVNDIVKAMGGWKTVSEELFAIWAVTKVLGLVASIGKVTAALTGLKAAGSAAGTGGLFAWLSRLFPLALPLALKGDTDPNATPDGVRKGYKPDNGPAPQERPMDEHHRPLHPAETFTNMMGRWRNGVLNFFGEGDKSVLDLVGKTEGTDKGRGYNETLGYGKYTNGDQNLTGMTLGQIDELQSKMLANPDNKEHSSALGRYQITQTTLRDLIKKQGLDPNAKFDEKMQDRLASTLIRERTGNAKNDNEYMRALATIWASLPDPTTGKSYYGQHTGATTDDVMRAIRAQRAAEAKPKDASKPPTLAVLHQAVKPLVAVSQDNSPNTAKPAGASSPPDVAPPSGITNLQDTLARLRSQQNAARPASTTNTNTTTNDHSSEVHVGQISIHTKATDAKGIAADISGAMKRQAIVPQSSYGLA